MGVFLDHAARRACDPDIVVLVEMAGVQPELDRNIAQASDRAFNPDRVVMLTFVIAAALAGMAGAMLGPVLVLTPFAGTSVIVKAFAIVIIGGFGNVEGTILAGLLVGLIESYTTQYLGPGLIDIVVFALLLLMLAVRPTGLIAEKREENV